MNLTIIHNGITHANTTPQAALAAGVPAALVGAALKGLAQSQVADFANANRARLASASAGKIAEWTIKAEIAATPDTADPEEKALIERGGQAHGRTLQEELSSILTKRSAYRKTALMIGALEDEAEAAIAALPDTAADIEAQIQSLLTTAKAQAEASIIAAQTQINGGA